jgi:hypothetical protein
MISQTLMHLELMLGIPAEALLSAPLAMGAGFHALKVAEGQPKAVHANGSWKGMEQKRALSPAFTQMALIGLVFGAVIGVAGLTGWLPGIDGLRG